MRAYTEISRVSKNKFEELPSEPNVDVVIEGNNSIKTI